MPQLQLCSLKTADRLCKSRAHDRESNHWSAQVDARYASRRPKTLDQYRGLGAFVSVRVVEANGELLTVANIVIAAGRKPRPGPSQDLPIWTCDDLIPLKGEVPKFITVFG